MDDITNEKPRLSFKTINPNDKQESFKKERFQNLLVQFHEFFPQLPDDIVKQ